MYNEFFGLAEDAFRLTPDPRFLYLARRQRKALEGLVRGIIEHKRLILLTGDPGTGKTTLIAAARAHLPADRARLSVIYHPIMKPADVVEAAILGFGMVPAADGREKLFASFEQATKSALEQGMIWTLVIDDAQKLSAEALAQVRRLGEANALQIVLVGQSEPSEMAPAEDQAAESEAGVVHLRTGALMPQEVRPYIEHRWKIAGGSLPPAFDGDAFEAITRYSRGIPRRINSLCDNALMSAYAAKINPAGESHVLHAARKLDLADSSGRSHAPGRAREAAASGISHAPNR